MSNRTLGTSFEQEFAQEMFDNGFWVHLLTQNSAGQPADVIAVMNQKAYLIDCKVCSNNRFPLTRVEANQHCAMHLWQMIGNGDAMFALKMSDDVYMIPYSLIRKETLNCKSTLTAHYIREKGISFHDWIEKEVDKCKS